MRKALMCKFQFCKTALVIALLTLLNLSVRAEVSIHGHVLDTNGRPVSQAQVTIVPGKDIAGASAITVFTDESGSFTFRDPLDIDDSLDAKINVRALGYRQVQTAPASSNGNSALTVLMESSSNQAGIAPASAWMHVIEKSHERNDVVMSCVSCHQFPSPEVRDYAGAIHMFAGDHPELARKQGWDAMVKYMNFLTAEESGRTNSRVAAFTTSEAYNYSRGRSDVRRLLSQYITGPLDYLEGYDYGAPLVVTPRTVIKEYEIDRPNAIREAALMGSPPKLWVADVNSNRIVRIDPVSGVQKDLFVPVDEFMGPHALHHGKDDHLWIAPRYNGIIARLNTLTEEWRVWKLRTESGGGIGIHDLSFDWQHDLVSDTRGRIWFSDIANNAVGYLVPETGEHRIYPVPEVPGRPGSQAALYGIVMSSDRQHIWYSQLGIGCFGSFNTETLQFEKLVQLPEINSGPRRLAISDKDILYVPLYGAGQLVEYDTRAGKMLGIYDLPDRASAPYAVTWDAVRQALWIPTSNANLIYRFNPTDKTFGVLPLPREGAFLRMLLVDQDTGMLVTSYANVLERVHGPRMAVLIDPGDDWNPSARTGMQGVNDNE